MQKTYLIVNKQVKVLQRFRQAKCTEQSLLLLCHDEEMYQTQYIGTCNGAYTNGYALN